MIVPIHPPLDGATAERFLALARSLGRTTTENEPERDGLLRDELLWVHNQPEIGDENRDVYEAAVRVLADLHRLGWDVRESGYGVELSTRTSRTGGLSPSEIRQEKERTRAIFRPAVKAQLGDPAVRTFVARMEGPGAKTGKRPVTLLIADGSELHGRLLVLPLTLSHRQFPKLFRSGTGSSSHINRTGGLAVKDGSIRDGEEPMCG